MLTKEQFKIATQLDDLGACYIRMSRDTLYTLYELSNGNLEFIEKTLDLAVDNFVEEDKIIDFFKDAINGTEIGIDELGQYLGYIDPRD